MPVSERQLEIACEKFAEFGIDFRCPWDSSLDDLELERFEALKSALEAALSLPQGAPELKLDDILALVEENDRLRNAVTASKPIIERLIAAEHNVETWGLKQRLAAIDAALARRLDGDVR